MSKTIYVVIDNGQPYSSHTVSIHKTALSIQEVVELVGLWNAVGRFYEDHAKIIAIAEKLYDVNGEPIDAPSLREEFGIDGENEYRREFNFDPSWWSSVNTPEKDRNFDCIAAKSRIIELIAKERV